MISKMISNASTPPPPRQTLGKCILPNRTLIVRGSSLLLGERHDDHSNILLCQPTGARHHHGTCCARLCRRTLLRLGLRQIYQLEDRQRGKAAQRCRCTRVSRERCKCCRQVLCETCKSNCGTRLHIFEHERLSREPKGKGRELLQILISPLLLIGSLTIDQAAERRVGIPGWGEVTAVLPGP